MQIITGGFAQGKLEYAVGSAGTDNLIIDENNYRDYQKIIDCKLSGMKKERVIVNHLNLIIKEIADRTAVLDLINEIKSLCSDAGAELTIISDELGCGIIPVDPADRQYRENNGRIMCILAAEADSVIRIVCGIPQKIK